MFAYIIRRLLLVIPTLFGIIVVNFIIVQAAPGGPVEQLIAQIKGTAVQATARISGATSGEVIERRRIGDTGGRFAEKYRGSRGLDPELIKEIEKLFGFDKPAHHRFFHMLKNHLVFDFGASHFRYRKGVSLVLV